MSVPTAIRRASLEKDDVQADPTATSGKADTAGRDERRRRPVAAPGYWRQHVHKESARNTGSPRAWSGMTNRTPARDRPGAHGVAERFVVPKKPGNAGGGKGPQFKTDARRGEGPGDWATSHGELWVKSVFIRACVKLRGLFRYPRSEPDCMTRPVSEHDQPHIRSPLETAVPTSRLRRAGAQGTKPFYQSACRAMVTIGSSTRIRQN